jgi:hypothetical protein
VLGPVLLLLYKDERMVTAVSLFFRKALYEGA